jgi:WS/DGAT/MGAT family acyltransferase
LPTWRSGPAALANLNAVLYQDYLTDTRRYCTVIFGILTADSARTDTGARFGADGLRTFAGHLPVGAATGLVSRPGRVHVPLAGPSAVEREGRWTLFGDRSRRNRRTRAGIGGLMGSRRPIGPVDAIWLNMDRPNNLMVVDALVLFDEPVDWDRGLAVLRDRLVRRFAVFGQRPAAPALPWIGAPRWEDDPDFVLDRHIHRVRLPEPGDDRALRRYIESRLCRPFDRSHPMWETSFVDGYRGGAAIFARFHHAISDGIAGANLLMSLTDATADGEPPDTVEGTDQTEPAVGGLIGSVLRRAGDAAGSAASGLSSFVAGLPGWMRPQRASAALTQTWSTLGVLNKLLLSSNAHTSFDGEPGTAKTAVWSRPLPLPEVKRAGRLADATVNDVLISALAGAFWTYLVEHDGSATDLTTMVPVNVRPVADPPGPDLGNRFTLVLMKLPSGVGAPLARLAETKRRMDAIKRSPEVAITSAMISAIGKAPEEVKHVLVNFFAGKSIGVTTNVIGPNTQRFFAGTKVAGLLAWAPTSGRQTVSACILTYDNTVRVGFKVDATTIRDPERLAAAFEERIDWLLRIP